MEIWYTPTRQNPCRMCQISTQLAFLSSNHETFRMFRVQNANELTEALVVNRIYLKDSENVNTQLPEYRVGFVCNGTQDPGNLLPDSHFAMKM